MSTATLSLSGYRRGVATRLARAGIATGISDFFFATVLNVVVLQKGTFSRLWQGVASVPFGKGVIDAGPSTVLLGIAVHFAVAFFWSCIFIVLLTRLPAVAARLRTVPGVLLVAAVYGPFIWVMMSLVLIPLALHRPFSLAQLSGASWWILLIGHFPFVGLPLVATARPEER